FYFESTSPGDHRRTEPRSGSRSHREHARDEPPMIADLTRKTPVIVQGAGGRAALRHIDRMLECGTNVVAGVSSRAGHMRGSIPLFETCREAVDATGSIVSLVMSPADRVLQATEEALDAGIRLIVTIAEGVPVQDALRIGAMIKTKGTQWIGASTPG